MYEVVSKHLKYFEKYMQTKSSMDFGQCPLWARVLLAYMRMTSKETVKISVSILFFFITWFKLLGDLDAWKTAERQWWKS